MLGETCIKIKGDLPQNSDTSESCAFFTSGGFDGPNPCSSGTFSQPGSFVIRTGFCTVYANDDCTGVANGIDSFEYSGCTDVDDAFVNLGSWGSLQCFVEGG